MSGVVVVGTGFGCVTHVRALRAAGFTVVALVGQDPKRTSARAAMFDIPLALTSLDRALDLDGVAAVTVATPPHSHAPIALAAIAAGKHVICEKPFTRDLDEARTVLAAAEAAGVVHLLGCEFRWDPGQALLARTVKSGAIGDPRLALVLLHVPLLAPVDADVPEWWADADQGGGWLGAHGSQLIDQIRVTLGEFESVCATLPHVARPEWTAEDGFAVHFRMQSGATGSLQSTSGDWGAPLVATRVVGTEGTAWIEGVGSTVRIADASGTRTLPVPDDLSSVTAPPLPEGLVTTAYGRMIAHGLDLGPYTRLAEVLGCRIEDRPPPPGPEAATFLDGARDMAALDAMRRSAADRSWVEVAEVPGP